MTIVARPTTSVQGKYDTKATVARILELGDGEALAVELSADCKWVNYHNAIYKGVQAKGMKLHYSRNGRVMTMWAD